MRSLRPSPAFRRRRTTALPLIDLDRMNPRSPATPIGLAAFAVGSIPLAAQIAFTHSTGEGVLSR